MLRSDIIRTLGVLFTVFSACTVMAHDHTVAVQQGETVVEVSKNPKKVVIFDIGTLETYHELGIPVYGMLSNAPDYLPEYSKEQYLKLGSIMKPEIEAIREAAPDLIIISGRQASKYDSLSQIAPTINLGVNTSDYWDSFEQNVMTIAKIHGKEELAAKKLTELRAKKEKVRTLAAKDSKKAVVFLHVKGKFNASGKSSRFSFAYDVLGVKSIPAIDTLSKGSLQITDKTFTGENNPDYLLIINRDAAVGGDAEQSPLTELLSEELKQTNAAKNNKLVNLSGNIWYLSGGGLISVDRMISEVGQQLYGIKF